MSDERKEELFEMNLDDRVHEVFGKTRSHKQPAPIKVPVDDDTEREMFAVQMGLQEINEIRAALSDMRQRIGNYVLSAQLTHIVKQYEEGLEYTSNILRWDFNPLSLIQAEGPNAYRSIIFNRKELIGDLLAHYEDGGANQQYNE